MVVGEKSSDFFMQEALKLAALAGESGEIPVGAVVVCEGRIIARAHNQVEMLRDPTAHAEMLAITSAAEYLGGKFLDSCTMYVTLEPCSMCAGALYWARIGNLVFGAADPKRGYRKCGASLLHQKTQVESGVLAETSTTMLNTFFRDMRGQRTAD